MYLKSIALKGFKSFPDRTRLEFGPGTSVIVGPNGSGKSNVTDAVLWVLGEQSPLAVRGHSMQDVIFSGAPGRQAATSASVELVLDDADGTLGLGPEVSIVRRLDRSGEGEYRLAGARCRLIDLLEVLSDTGLGKEMHSVISQGRVESIVTSKPRDRRLLIEEAAGLGKHRKRRRRAQLKLAHTEENLDRALDVEREARSRLRPLKRQAEAAELHERLHRQTLEVRWQLAGDDLRARRAELHDAGALVTAAREARQRLEGELEAVGVRRREAEEALAARSSQREELSRRSFAAQSAADRVGYRADAVRAASVTVRDRLDRGRASLEALIALHEADNPDPEAEARIVALAAELEALDRDREAEVARQIAELEQERLKAVQTVAAREQELSQAGMAREQADAVYRRAREQVREAERGAEAARRHGATVGGELAAVNQFLRSHQSTPGGARSLADALTVSSGHELAVAAALDGRLGAALASDREQAAALLERASREGGRVVIVGMRRRAGVSDMSPPGPSPPAPGAERLADHIAGDDEPAALARGLLRDAWLVDRLEDVADDFEGVAVTRSGRVFAPAASELRQAAAVGEERVLAERNRRDELIAASEAAAQAEQSSRAQVEAAVAEAGRLDAAREATITAHRSAAVQRDEAAEQTRRLSAAIERRRSAPDEGPGAGRRAQLDAELRAERGRVERAERDRAERAAQIERLRAGIARDVALGPVIAGIVEDLETILTGIGERSAEFEAALVADREAGETVAGQLRACAQEEAGIQHRLHTASEELTAAEVRAQRARDRAADAESA
jgi:chromosome segregation protein